MRCISICKNWNSRIRWKNRCASKTKYRLPILIPPTPQKAARQLAWVTRFAQWQGREPESAVADTNYGSVEFLQWLADRNITPYIRTRDSIHRKNSPFFGP